jgi:membrane-bound ClpP family serine protease
METTLILAYVLIGVGFLLLVGELFLPSGGVLPMLTVACLAVGVSLAFYYDSTTGLVTLIGVFIALPVVGGVLLHYWPRTRMGKQMFLHSPEAEGTVATESAQEELRELVGRFGKTVSSLRPSGVCDFDGRRIDTITEGMMIDPGEWVRCIDVKGGKVTVRLAEKPTTGTLSTTDFS